MRRIAVKKHSIEVEFSLSCLQTEAALGRCVVGWTRHNTDENEIDVELVTVITTTIVCRDRVRATRALHLPTSYSTVLLHKFL